MKLIFVSLLFYSCVNPLIRADIQDLRTDSKWCIDQCIANSKDIGNFEKLEIYCRELYEKENCCGNYRFCNHAVFQTDCVTTVNTNNTYDVCSKKYLKILGE